MKIYFENGLHVLVDGKHVLFDPTTVFGPDHQARVDAPGKPDLVVVSHGHADHCNDLSRHVDAGVPCIMHAATAEIVSRYVNVDIPSLPARHGQKMTVDGIELEAFDAAHCVGSLQFKMRTSSGDIVFTGDINHDGSMSMEPAPAIAGDVLVIDTTSWNPPASRESSVILLETTRQFIDEAISSGRPAIIYGYPLGTAQEMTTIANNMERDVNVYLDRVPFEMNRVYDKHVKQLGKYHEAGDFVPKENSVIVANLSWVKHEMDISSKIRGLARARSMVACGKKLNAMLHVEFSFHSRRDTIEKYVGDGGFKAALPFHGDHGAFPLAMYKRGVLSVDPHSGVFSFPG